MSRLLSIAVENSACLGSIFLYHDPSAAKGIERWLASKGYTKPEYYLNGESGLILEDRAMGDSTLIRIGPYSSTQWMSHMNRAWAPFTVQPTEFRIAPIDREQLGRVYSGDSLSVEIMPRLQPSEGRIDPRLAENTGIAIFSADKDIARMSDGTLVLLDPDCTGLLNVNAQTNWPWRDYASRQNMLHIIHKNTAKLGLPQHWVVEKDGVFYPKQETLYGPDYLTRRRAHSLMPRRGHYAQRSPVDVLSL